LLKELTEKKVVFCELVEHPGGHDGGEFPQYHTVGLADDGSAYYATDYPECPTDGFCDEEIADYQAVETHGEAIKYVESGLKKLGLQPGVAQRLLEGLAVAEVFEVRLPEEED